LALALFKKLEIILPLFLKTFNFRITNPILYSHVDAAIPTPDKWCSKLSSQENEKVQKAVDDAKAHWNNSYNNLSSYKPGRLCRNTGPWAEMGRASSNDSEMWDTGYNTDTLRYILAKSVEVPEGFKINAQLERHTRQRIETAKTGQKIDWGCAEAMAFGSLLQVNSRL
jgi:probable 2-oxoglutarate dehydrogenase E1 component DHKTD1